MAELRWGILSTARIAREKVIPGLRRADRCRIVAIASRDAARATEVAREAGIPTAYGSYEALLEDPMVDAVYIPLPNHLHAEWTIAAARAGKHVLCEKPLALTSADAERMIEVADSEGGAPHGGVHVPPPPLLGRRARAGRIGRIGRLVAVQSWFSYFNDDPTNIRNIREFGGGALFDIGCYGVNLSRMLFGGEPTRVEARSFATRGAGSTRQQRPARVCRWRGELCLLDPSAEDDQRVDVYGTDGRISIGIPFNIPPDRPTRIFCRPRRTAAGQSSDGDDHL